MEQPSARDKERFQRAMQALQGNDPQEAVRLFEEVRNAWRDDADIRYLEGLAYGKLDNPVKVKEVSEKGLELDPAHFGALCNLANAQMLLRDTESALENYAKALAAKPDAPEVLDNYGRALGMLGRREEAIAHYRKALAARQDFAPAHASLARAYAEGGDTLAAMAEYQVALRLDPDDYLAHLGMAALNVGAGGHQMAEYHYKEALRIRPSDVQAYIGLANVMLIQGSFDKAFDYITQAEQAGNHDNPGVRAVKANCLEHIGEAEQAYEILNELAEAEQMTPLAVVAYSRVCRKFGTCDKALELIDLSAATPATNSMERRSLHYAAGSLLDKLKRYDEAFDYYRRANEEYNLSLRSDYTQEYDRLIGFFSKEAMANLPRARTGSTRPIFILGMPRSGTTLTEQILASHPAVFGAGELNNFKRAANKLAQSGPLPAGKLTPEDKALLYTHQIAQAGPDGLTNLANEYLDSLNELNSVAHYVTDKMPHNFELIGLIALLFPEARIIHCRRNPLDNGLSIYFQNFIWSHDYATDLGNIGYFYGEYERLMRHWKAVIDIPMLTVQYEDLIEDQEGVSRRLLEFCGLDWDDSVLHFHKSERVVTTSSYNQVREPIYKTSHARWKNYSKYIGPLKDALPAHCILGIEDLDTAGCA